MIKLFVFIVLFATVLQCQVISEEIPVPISSEERTVDTSDNTTSKDAKSESTQVSSKEASTEGEKAAKSESSAEITDNKAAESEATEERHVRSTEENKLAKDDESAAVRTNDEKSDDSKSSAGSDESKSARISRNSDETYSGKGSRLRSGIKTETAERDDAPHINIKESRNAPEEESEETPSNKSGSEDPKSAPEEQDNSKSASTETKRTSEPESKAADEKGNVRSFTDAGEVAALINTAPTIGHMLNQNSNLRESKDERSDAAEPADTRMAPQEEPPSSGHQVNLFGDNEPQSQYPYTPLENPNPSSNLHPIFKQQPSLLPMEHIQSLGRSETQNPLPPLQIGPSRQMIPPLSPLEPFQPFKPLPPLPPLEKHAPFKLLPPLPPLEPFKPLRPLQPLDQNRLFEPLPPLPPLQPHSSFKLLPPLQPLQRDGLFEPLPPLPPLHQMSPFKRLPRLPPLEPIGPFKHLPPPQPLERFEAPRETMGSVPHFMSQGHIETPPSGLRLGSFNIPHPNQYLQLQQMFPNAFPHQPQDSIKKLPRQFPVLRQAGPESSGGSAYWFHAEETPNAVSSTAIAYN